LFGLESGDENCCEEIQLKPGSPYILFEALPSPLDAMPSPGSTQTAIWRRRQPSSTFISWARWEDLVSRDPVCQPQVTGRNAIHQTYRRFSTPRLMHITLRPSACFQPLNGPHRHLCRLVATLSIKNALKGGLHRCRRSVRYHLKAQILFFSSVSPTIFGA
jgi:hypothetical protein